MSGQRKRRELDGLPGDGLNIAHRRSTATLRAMPPNAWRSVRSRGQRSQRPENHPRNGWLEEGPSKGPHCV